MVQKVIGSIGRTFYFCFAKRSCCQTAFQIFKYLCLFLSSSDVLNLGQRNFIFCEQQLMKKPKTDQNAESKWPLSAQP